MHIYKIISAAKFFLGAWIMLIIFTSINIYEDPITGIGLGFLGLFIASRWLSFFLFLWIQKFYRKNLTEERLMKDSYKLSLLFGIYVMLNVTLILSEYRNKLIWLLLLWWFVLLQMSLFWEENNHDRHQK